MVIVTWNAAAVVEGCLRSISDRPPSLAWEVCVVDNGSTDATVATVRATLPSAQVIANPSNRGLAAANNQGIKATNGEVILICNPDVRFEAGAIDAMVDVVDRRPGAGWVVPRLHYEDGRLQTSAGDLPTLIEALLGRQILRGRGSAQGAPSGMWWDGWSHAEERTIGRGHEAAYVVRRDAVRATGLQDERYVLDWEGVDWTDRMRRAGWQVWLCPDADVVHLGGASIRQVPYRWLWSQHTGMYRYFSLRRPPWIRPALAVVIAARGAVKLLALVAGPARYERSHGDGAFKAKAATTSRSRPRPQRRHLRR